MSDNKLPYSLSMRLNFSTFQSVVTKPRTQQGSLTHTQAESCVCVLQRKTVRARCIIYFRERRGGAEFVCVYRDGKPRGEDMLLAVSTAHRACDRQPVTVYTNTQIHNLTLMGLKYKTRSKFHTYVDMKVERHEVMTVRQIEVDREIERRGRERHMQSNRDYYISEFMCM